LADQIFYRRIPARRGIFSLLLLLLMKRLAFRFYAAAVNVRRLELSVAFLCPCVYERMRSYVGGSALNNQRSHAR